MIPGSNLLGQALGAITPQLVIHYAATGRTTNAQGRETVTFAPAAPVYGSFQPLSAARAVAAGLDAAKSYSTFYAQQPFAAPSREGPADLLVYGGNQWRVVDVLSWFAQDGWEGVVAVLVGPATAQQLQDAAQWTT